MTAKGSHTPGQITCPKGMGPAARAEWRRIRDAITERGMDPRQFAGALEEYAREYDLVRSIEKRWRDEGSPLLHRSDGGQEYQHPLLKMLDQHRRTLAQLADRVGASPRGARMAQPAKPVGRPRGTAPLGSLKPASARLRAVKGGA